jgi:hypothetical protein
MISVDKKFLFIHIPKTGGNAIRLALQPHAIDEIVFNEKQQAYNESTQQINRFGISNPYMDLKKHSTLAEIHAQWDERHLGPWEEYFKFAVIRNPWDRLVSLYFSPHKGNADFDRKKFTEVVKNEKKGMQSPYVTENGRLATDSLIRFESLVEDFARVCDRLGIVAELPHVNKSSHQPYREYYDKKLMNLVYKLYREDIDRFGYEF